MSSPRITAVLLDIDGTLVDSNYLHVGAWSRAFQQVGQQVPSWRIHRAIGMDSAKLVNQLLGDAVNAVGEAAKQAHGDIYAGLAGQLRVFDGARELVTHVDRAGQRAVLATSAPENELATLLALLALDNHIDVVTSAEDVGTAKPAPDIVQVALERANVAAEYAVFVGDTVWDVAAAARAGVGCVGVRSGGVSEAELRDAGAIAVYDDSADLLQHYADSPLAAG